MASLFSSPTPTRPLVIHSPSARVSIPVAASPLSAWVQSETLSQQFHDSRIGLDDDVAPIEEDDEDAVKSAPSNEPQVKLLARFLGFTADRASSDSDNSEITQVLSAAFNRFNELFLARDNIQSLVEGYEPEIRAEVLSAYYKAYGGRPRGELKVAHPSALLGAANAGEAELYALFGGQGVNEVSISIVQADFSTISKSSKRCTTSTHPFSTHSSLRSPTRCSFPSPIKPTRMASPTIPAVSTSSHGSMAPSHDHPSTTSRPCQCLCPSSASHNSHNM